MQESKTCRVIIETVTPQIDNGAFPVKRVVGETVRVVAHVFTDGHDELLVRLLYRVCGEKKWGSLRMRALGNDEWEAFFVVDELTPYEYTVQAAIDPFGTWRKDVQKKIAAGQDITTDLAIGQEIIANSPIPKKRRGYYEAIMTSDTRALTRALEDEHFALDAAELVGDKAFVTYEKKLRVTVDRPQARYSTWYELFPRSTGEKGAHGTFADCERLLPAIARMGFDVVYLPPIHPIGKTHRKGKNNAVVCAVTDPGSPWAIGNARGGHQAVHPALGTLADFKRFLRNARKVGLEVALDIAFQCSPDHPYVQAHPEWFRWRPDGTIQYAENPPKKYEDIIPFHFDTAHRQTLWEELRGVFLFWIGHGVRIFRVDNPHTKPFAFWDWLIDSVKRDYPDVIFLAEAFTRPKPMRRLAKGGFTQSYTYFTWRNTKQELTEYLTELTHTELAEYLRPNFWPNTPDILPEVLQRGGKPAFMMRLVLAATLSSNYGIYGPAFELCVNEALEGKEEYRDSEKYEIKQWDLSRPGNIRPLVTLINRIRREHPALQQTRTIEFCQTDNEQLIAYAKFTPDCSNILVTVVNLDPFHPQSGWLTLPLARFGIDERTSYAVHDLLSNDRYLWQGGRNYVSLDPQTIPAHVLRVTVPGRERGTSS